MHMRHLVNIWQMTSSMEWSACPKLSMFGLVFVIPKKVGIFRTSKWMDVWRSTARHNTPHMQVVFIKERR